MKYSASMTWTSLMTFIIIWLSTVPGDNHWHLAIVLSIIHTFTLLMTPMVSSNIWPLHLCVRRFTDSDYSYGIFKCMAIALSVLWFTNSDYPFGTFRHLTIAFLSFLDLRFLITLLISSNIWPLHLSVLRFTNFDYFYDIFKCLIIVLSVLRRVTDLDFALGIFKMVAIALSVLRFTASDFLFDTFKLLNVVLSVLRYSDSGYPFGIFKLFLQLQFYSSFFNILFKTFSLM